MLTFATRFGLLLPLLAEASIVLAQSQLKFEVASVKPATEQTMSIRAMPGGRLVGTAPLKLLIMKAYGLQYSRIAGGPEWINEDRFEIQAEAGQDVNSAQLMTMLQNLLEDRFRMKVHRENRETPVYDLVVDKGGSQLASTKVSECPPADTLTPSAQPDAGAPAPCGKMRIVPSASGVKMEGDRVPISELVGCSLLDSRRGRCWIAPISLGYSISGYISSRSTPARRLPICPGLPCSSRCRNNSASS